MEEWREQHTRRVTRDITKVKVKTQRIVAKIHIGIITSKLCHAA